MTTTAPAPEVQLWSTMPGWGIAADLTPPELINSRELKTLRRWLGAGLIVLLVACAGGYVVADRQHAAASSALDEVEGQTFTLQAGVRKYADVTRIQANVSQIQTQIATLMRSDVDLSELLGHLRSTLPAGMTITSAAVTINQASVAAVPPGTPISSPTTIGTVVISGTGRALGDLAAYVDNLATVPGLVDIDPTTNVVSAGAVRFSLSISLTTVVLAAIVSITRRRGASDVARAGQADLVGRRSSLAVVIIAFGWLAIISPKLSSTKTLRGEADSARAQNSVLATKAAALKRQNDNVGQLKTDLRAALAALPFDSGLPEFTRQLAGQATENHVSLTSVTMGTVTPTTTTVSPTTPTPTAGTTAPGTTADPSAAATPATVLAVPITLVSQGSSTDEQAFLKAIQVLGPRRALIISTTFSTGSSSDGQSIDKSATVTTQLNVFLAPLSVEAQAQLAKLLSTQ